ncbi:hypothetical protein EVAR_17706_1 [Eumeta japonica]|uniref:Uncharacterized protein n=1 Tax=Eumeta variegata TaxID=151549 RepID=A0A4C1URT7_EUMVA|nr:hypothetical protein EVAR_17706_1 [Eumeta japonica]
MREWVVSVAHGPQTSHQCVFGLSGGNRLSDSRKRRNGVKLAREGKEDRVGECYTCALHHSLAIQSGKVSCVVLRLSFFEYGNRMRWSVQSFYSAWEMFADARVGGLSGMPPRAPIAPTLS